MNDARYTDDWPLPEVLRDFPNWVTAFGEEGRRGQDETTIRPQKKQSRIDDNTAYSAGHVEFCDQTKMVCLLRLSWGRVKEIIIYGDDGLWFASVGAIGEIPVDRLPLQYCSRLRYDGERLMGTIDSNGNWTRLDKKR